MSAAAPVEAVTPVTMSLRSNSYVNNLMRNDSPVSAAQPMKTFASSFNTTSATRRCSSFRSLSWISQSGCCQSLTLDFCADISTLTNRVGGLSLMHFICSYLHTYNPNTAIGLPTPTRRLLHVLVYGRSCRQTRFRDSGRQVDSLHLIQ